MRTKFTTVYCKNEECSKACAEIIQIARDLALRSLHKDMPPLVDREKQLIEQDVLLDDHALQRLPMYHEDKRNMSFL